MYGLWFYTRVAGYHKASCVVSRLTRAMALVPRPIHCTHNNYHKDIAFTLIRGTNSKFLPSFHHQRSAILPVPDCMYEGFCADSWFSRRCKRKCCLIDEKGNVPKDSKMLFFYCAWKSQESQFSHLTLGARCCRFRQRTLQPFIKTVKKNRQWKVEKYSAELLVLSDTASFLTGNQLLCFLQVLVFRCSKPDQEFGWVVFGTLYISRWGTNKIGVKLVRRELGGKDLALQTHFTPWQGMEKAPFFFSFFFFLLHSCWKSGKLWLTGPWKKYTAVHMSDNSAKIFFAGAHQYTIDSESHYTEYWNVLFGEQ